MLTAQQATESWPATADENQGFFLAFCRQVPLPEGYPVVHARIGESSYPRQAQAKKVQPDRADVTGAPAANVDTVEVGRVVEPANQGDVFRDCGAAGLVLLELAADSEACGENWGKRDLIRHVPPSHENRVPQVWVMSNQPSYCLSNLIDQGPSILCRPVLDFLN